MYSGARVKLFSFWGMAESVALPLKSEILMIYLGYCALYCDIHVCGLVEGLEDLLEALRLRRP